MTKQRKDLTGKRFGRLTVIERVYSKSKRNGEMRAMWHCKCDCGNERDILGSNLMRGLTKSCGCLHNEELGNRRIIDLTGKRFGRLVVIGRADNKGKETYWKCKCDCGSIKEINGNRLRNGRTKSCGCLKRNIKFDSSVQNNSNLTHGKSKTRLYRIYQKMKRRCYRPEEKYYENYGGRGIDICDEWREDFQAFYDWAMENGYSDDLSIDRRDNDKGYSPDNCKWSTAKEQANNTRSTIFITYKGNRKPVSEWSKIIGIRQDTLSNRKRKGWSDEKCIETPLNRTKGIKN